MKLTDEQVIKVVDICLSIDEDCADCPLPKCGDCDRIARECFHDLVNRKDTKIAELTEENNRLKAENNDLLYKLQGVMLSVDKWLEGEELKQDEVNRAVTMREKTLQITERQQAEIDKLERTISHLEDVCNGIPDVVRAEAIKEFVERLKLKKFLVLGSQFNNECVTTKQIDNLVKEMVGEEQCGY